MVHYIDVDSRLTWKVVEVDEEVGLVQRGLKMKFYDEEFEVVDYKISLNNPENLYVFIKKLNKVQ